MEMFLDGRAVRSPVYQGVLKPAPKPVVEATYGVVLLDRRGCLVGASTAGSLPGEVETPPGVDLRKADVRPYVGCRFMGGRCFSLISATWVQVKSQRVRVGIYMESGDRHISPDLVEPDLGSIVAILSAQVA
jgi:hypothetical protein